MESIPISDDDAKLIEKQVKSGRFESAADVVSAGLKLLAEMEADAEAWLQSEALRRFAEYDGNPSIGVPLETVRGNIGRLHERTLKAER